jgi:hypothetical protein
MPTVLRIDAYRFFFYANDEHEPPHIHVRRDEKVAKFWLNPIRIEKSSGFSRSELRDFQAVIKEHQRDLAEKWNDYFQS